MTDTTIPDAGSSDAGQKEEAKVAQTPSLVPEDLSAQTPVEPAKTENNQSDERKRSKGGFQRREERLKQEVEFWREQALKSNQQKPEERKEEATADTAPKLEDFDSYDAYQDARTEYLADKAAEKRFAERDKQDREKSRQADRDKQLGTHRERMEKYAAEHADFKATVDESESPFTEAMRDACIESEKGPEIIDYLAKNPDKADAMTKMGITALNREIGRIEAMLEKQPVTQQTKVATKAPAPFTPVNSGNSSDPGAYRKDMTQAQYERWRKNGGGQRR